MTIDSKAIARMTWWASLALNVWAIGLSVAHAQIGQAGLQSLAVVGLAAGAWVLGTIDLKLQAQIGHHVAGRRMQELALSVMQAQVRAGNLSVTVFDAQPRAPVN
jgi:hypothetical protein